MTRDWFTPTRLSLIGFAIVLLLAWFCYQPALSGAFTLDDRGHFEGLALIEDSKSAIDYVMSGSNGPTGRPIAMATFAAQASDFADGATAFLRVNVWIHLINGVLLLWVLRELATAIGLGRERAALVAVAAASVWLVLALNATATLLAVQRMTTLATMFALAGLGAYLVLRRRGGESPSLVALTAVLFTATGLATLTKETGLLLPLFVLVVEATLLRAPQQVPARRWRAWQLVVLAGPGLVALAYLAAQTIYPDWMEARRGFGGVERLLTEARVLWLYLSKALVGLPGRLGIFQPDITVSRSLFEPVTLIAVLAWIALAAYSIVRRRRAPLLAFGVLWFLAGHLIESTVLPLEVYFEHRNYLPLVGPVFAASAFLLGGSRRWFGLGLATVAIFFVVNAGFLYTFASMWGDPSTSARYWAHRYPDSIRATTNLASYQLNEEGPQRTIDTIRGFVRTDPGHAYLRIQELNLLCMFGASGDLSRNIASLSEQLRSVHFTYVAGSMLSELFSTSTRVDCQVTSDTVRALAGALLDNPRYRGDPYFNQFHHKLMAAIARHEGDVDRALAELETAMTFWATPELNMMMVTGLVAEGEFAAAESFIDDALLAAPGNPLKAWAWRRDLENLRSYVRAVDMSLRDSEHSQDTQEPPATDR